jgi:hypothetical protein
LSKGIAAMLRCGSPAGNGALHGADEGAFHRDSRWI